MKQIAVALNASMLTCLAMFRLFAALIALLATGCGGNKPGAGDAQQFLVDAESKMLTADLEASRAAWVANNFITQDTESLSAVTNERAIRVGIGLTKQAARFDGNA